MRSWISRLQAGWVRLWRVDAPLAACAGLMLGVLAACALGLWLDPRLVLGAPVWLKPTKFAASIGIYCVTLLWVFSQLPGARRTVTIVGRTTAAALLLEMGIIATQAARGTTSHFNVSTPVNGVLFGIMGAAIVIQTLSTVAVAVALFRQRFADRALGWALRLGMVISIAGASIGAVMTRPSDAQLAEMQAGRPLVSGAHTVGAPDGGPGIPVLGWSRDHGDVRVAHFVGLHALQVLPLLALGLRRRRMTEPQRTRLVIGGASSYAAFVGILLGQALRGQPLLALDGPAFAALVLWLGCTGAGAWHVLSRRSVARAAAASPRPRPA